jgi:hypothetical protein
LVVASSAKQRQQQQHHQRTHGGTKVKMFTSPEDLDLFKFIYSKYLFCAQILFSFEKGTSFWTFLAICTAF